jgi:uncharacterized membrane protein
MFRNKANFYGEEMSTSRPNPKLKDHPLLTVRDCLFNIFAAILHIGGRFSIRNLRTRHAMVTGTHLSRSILYYSPQIFEVPNNFIVMSVYTLLVSCRNLSPFCMLSAVFAMATLDLISRFHLALFVIMLTKQLENFKYFSCF